MPESCGRCPGWTGSIEDVLEVLSGKWRACEACTEREMMRAVVHQHRSRHPQWWVVDGRRVIPIWIVEHLRNSRPESALFPPLEEKETRM